MKLLTSPLAYALLISSFAACSPSNGSGGSNDTNGGASPGGGASGTGQGGANTGGTPATGGSAGTPATGGGSGTGLGGSAGVSATGGSSGVAGTAGVSGAPTGGTAGAGVGGTAGDAGASGTAGDAGAATGGAGGSGGGAYTGTIIVQDDFNAQANAAAPDSAKWQLYPDYAPAQQPIIDNTRSHSAPNAAKTRGNPSFLIPRETAVLGGTIAPSNKFYIRFWVNFEKATAMIGNHSTFLVGSVAKDNSGTELRVGFSSNQSGKPEMLDLNLQNATDGGEVTRYSNGFTDGGNPGNFAGMGIQFNANQWYCMEALFDGGGSEFRMWIADAEVMEMHVHDFSGNGTGARTMWGPMFRYLKVGTQDYSGQIGQVWYDDVFVGTAPIGCAR